MKIAKILLYGFTAVSVICAIVGVLLILGAVGRVETDPTATIGWMFTQCLYGVVLCIPAAISVWVMEALDLD